jgi:hypothetical protein
MEAKQGLYLPLVNFLCKTSLKSKKDKSDFIVYKIVDSYFLSQEERLVLQCINTKAQFNYSLKELVFDVNVLYSLHPIQSCYVGIEFAKLLKLRNQLNQSDKFEPLKILSQERRYGNKNLQHRTRDGQLGFRCLKSGEVFEMDPKEIATTPELIQEFDAQHAFCIGYFAGLRFYSAGNYIRENHRPYIRLVKG